MSWLGIHVKGLRKHAGLTQAQLAQRIMVGITTIENIETGYLTAPPITLLDKIAKTFDVTTETLLTAAPLEMVSERVKEVYVVKEISCDVALPAWNDVSDVIYVDRDVLRGYDHIAIRVKDNSMLMAGITCDAIALVRIGAPIKTGDIVLALYEDKSIVRKYYPEGSKILLRAANTFENYPDIFLDADKDRSNIIGKVIKVETYV